MNEDESLTPPPAQLAPEKVQEFRALLEDHLDRKLDESDEVIEQWARDAIETVWLLREIGKNVAKRKKTALVSKELYRS